MILTKTALAFAKRKNRVKQDKIVRSLFN